MPRLTQEELKWLYELQSVLKKEFDIDTSNKMQIGRLKLIDYTNEKTGEKLPAETPMDPKAYYDIKVTNACTVREVPEKGTPQERLDAHAGFKVELKENGEYELHTDMSDDVIHQLYQHAKSNKLFANNQGFNITQTTKGCGGFILIGKDGSPLVVPAFADDVTNLEEDKLREFYQKHPDMLDRPLDDPDLIDQVSYEYSPLANVDDPQNTATRMCMAVQLMQSTGISGDTTTLNDMLYEVYFWKTLNENGGDTSQLISEPEWVMLNRNLVGALVINGSGFDIESGTGMDNLFYYSEEDNTVHPITEPEPDKNLSNSERVRQMQDRILRHLKDGSLYAAIRESGKIKLTAPALTDDGVKLRSPEAPAEPEQPNPLKRFLHWLNNDWFKPDFDRYEAQKAKKSYLTTYLDSGVKPILEEKQKELDALLAKEEEPGKPCTAEEFQDKLARGILKALQKATGRTYLSSKNLKPEDIKQSPSFAEFLETPYARKRAQEVMSGKGVSMSLMGTQYIEFAAKKTEVKPNQTEPTANAVSKNMDQPQAQVISVH